MLMCVMLCVLGLLTDANRQKPITVDVVELNTYGPCKFQQIILRQWSDSPHGVGHWITDWRTVVDCEVTRRGNRTRVRFTDSNGVVHDVLARTWTETRTSADIEVMERRIYPAENRIPQLR